MSVIYIKLFEPIFGIERTLVLPSEGLPLDDLQSIIKSSFSGYNAIGLHDSKSNIDYPISVLAKNPTLLCSTHPLTIIVNNENRDKLLAGSDSKLAQDSKTNLCTEDIAALSFRQLDLNKDGLIHKEEMVEYLSRAFEFLYIASTRSSMNYLPSDLAEIIAQHCFQCTGSPDDGYINFDDFCGWYLSSREDKNRELMIFAIESFSNITNAEQDMLTSPSAISGKDQPFFSIDDRESLVKMPRSPPKNYEENSISSEEKEEYYSEDDENDVEFEDENILILKNNKTDDDDSNSLFVEYDGRHIGIQNGCQILGLNSYSSGYIIQHFRDLSEDNGKSYGIISHSRFHQGLSSLINRHYSTLSVRNQAIADYIISSLFRIFDPDESGYFDLQDMSCGLLLLCGGSLREKSESASIIIKDQYCFDEIAAERMASCFTSIFKVAMCLDPNFISMSTAEDVAAEITISAWTKSGLVLYENDKLPRSDFESWVNIVLSQFQDETEDKHYSDNDSIGQNINLSLSNYINSDTESEGDDLEDSSSSVILELRVARSILGLNNYTADDLMETLGEAASHGILSMNSFLEALTNIAGLTIPTDQRPISLSLGKRIFNYFDVQGKGIVLYSDFAAGFATLSDSPYSDKIMVGFTCLDGDGDGLLSFKEVERLILANLKVTVASSEAANNKLNNSSVELNSLAFLVTQDGFSSLDVPFDSYLNLEQVILIASDCMRVSNCF